jgi:hypothetical protein
MYRNRNRYHRIGRGNLVFPLTNGDRFIRRARGFDPSSFINNAYTQNDSVESYKIINSFSDFKIEEKLKANIFEKGYKIPPRFRIKQFLQS